MNKRQRKKKIANILSDIKVLNLKEDDLLVLKIDFTKYTPMQVQDFLKELHSTTNIKIVPLPTKSDLYKIPKERILKFLESY